MVEQTGALDAYYRNYEADADFIAEGLAMTVVEDALRIMESNNLSRADLAKVMGVSRPLVSRFLNAPPNLTLRSVARLAVALDVRPFVGLDVDSRQRAMRPAKAVRIEELEGIALAGGQTDSGLVKNSGRPMAKEDDDQWPKFEQSSTLAA